MTQYARTELEGCKRNLDVLQNDFETKKMWTTSITIISSNLGENSFRQSKLKSFFVILSVFGSMLYSIFQYNITFGSMTKNIGDVCGIA